MSFALILRNLTRRRTRTLLGVLGILITLALVTTIQVALDSVSVSFLDLVSLQAGRADLVITRKDGDPYNPTPFDPAEVTRALSAVKAIRGVSPRLSGLAKVQAGSATLDALFVGIDLEKERLLDIAGISPVPSRSVGFCSISKSLAEKLKLAEGSPVVLISEESFSQVQLKVDRVLARQQLLPQQVRDYVILHLDAARELTGLQEGVHGLAGALNNAPDYYDPRDLHGSVMRLKQAGAQWAARLGMEYDLRLPKAAALTAFRDFTSPLRAVFGVFAVLALVIAGLLIYSLLSVAVEERIREYAILRTIGARRRQVWGHVMTESLVMCLAGVIPGILAGVVCARFLTMFVALAMGGNVGAIQLELRPATMLWTLAASILLALISALFPALHATRWKIVDALDPLRRGQVHDPAPKDGNSRPLVLTGLALSALSGVVFFVLPSALFSGNPSLIGTVFLCLLLLMLLGLTLSCLGALPLLQKWLLFLTGGLFSPAAELIERNLRRHRRRHATTALLFSLSVSLVVFIASLVALAARTAISLVEHSTGADVRVHAFGPGNQSLKPLLEGVEGVGRVSEARFLHSRSEYGVAYDVVMTDLVGMRYLWVVPYGVDENLTQVLHPKDEAEAKPAENALRQVCQNISVGLENLTNAFPPVVLSLAAADYLGVQPGDVVQLSFRLGSERADGRFRIAGIRRTLPGFDTFRSRVAHAVGSGLLIPSAEFERLTRTAPAEAFQALYFVQTPADLNEPKQTARKIREQLDVRHRAAVKSTAEQKQDAQAVYWVTQILFAFLLVAAVVIAAFALIASMTATVMERTREVGVLKALGMRRGELLRLFLGEAVILTLSAGMAGGFIGFVLAWLFVVQATVLMEVPVAFTMPYFTLLATVLVSLLAGSIAAYLPTRSLLRRTAAEILRT